MLGNTLFYIFKQLLISKIIKSKSYDYYLIHTAVFCKTKFKIFSIVTLIKYISVIQSGEVLVSTASWVRFSSAPLRIMSSKISG